LAEGFEMGLMEHRREIEAIDEKIIRLIGQRNGMAKSIFEAKKKEGKEINDAEQEKLVLGRAIDLATELNLDAGAIKEIFSILIGMSLQKQYEFLGEDKG
jgi:chorismate mutase